MERRMKGSKMRGFCEFGRNGKMVSERSGHAKMGIRVERN